MPPIPEPNKVTSTFVPVPPPVITGTILYPDFVCGDSAHKIIILVATVEPVPPLV